MKNLWIIKGKKLIMQSIETGDWFSFESQKPKYILWGDNLKNFIKLNFPYKYKNPD